MPEVDHRGQRRPDMTPEHLVGRGERAMTRRWSFAMWVVAGAVLIVMAVPALAAVVQPLDDAIWEFAVSAERAPLVGFAEILNIVGGLTVMGPVMVAVAVVLAWRRRWLAFAAWLLAMVSSQALSLLIKEVYARPRPPLPLVDESGTGSFPSGQAVTAAAVALMLVLVLWPRDARLGDARLRVPLLVATAYALMIAASRVYLRVHWFSDVVEGLLIGGACAITAVLAVEWWRAKTSG